MAREFPRFLYSDPKNTKSPGPFIVHTLHPNKLFKVEFTSLDKFLLHDLPAFGEQCTSVMLYQIIESACIWLESQLKSGNVKSPVRVIKYDLTSAFISGVKSHPQEVVQSLGMKVLYYEGVPIGDCVMMQVLNVPVSFPDYIEYSNHSFN